MSSKIFSSKNSGLSILEALVSTEIVGIGFIAILQMTNFSVQSIDNSGERTKANFISTMIVEDVIGNRNTFYKKKADDMGAPTAANPKFSEHLAGNTWSADNCVNSADGTGDQVDVDATKDIYKEQKDNAPENKIDKWQAVLTKGRFLKCKSNKETKKLQVFKMCRWSGCDIAHADIYDEPMYIGRLEVLLNDGKKRKYIYFQSDYKIKE